MFLANYDKILHRLFVDKNAEIRIALTARFNAALPTEAAIFYAIFALVVLCSQVSKIV